MAGAGVKQRGGRALGRAVRGRRALARSGWPVRGGLGALAPILAALALAPGALAAGRPNIVLIQADDQTAAQFTPRVMPETTRLLADHGTVFRDYMVTTALCCPSRASMITGQYAHNDGVINNDTHGGGYGALIDKGNVLPVWLQQAGYKTIHLGKFLNGYAEAVPNWAEPAPGWDDWQTLGPNGDNYYDYYLSDNGTVVHKGTADGDYVTSVLTRKAVQAVHQYAPSRHPFYLQLDERAPHVARGNRPGRCNAGIRYPEPAPEDMGAFRHAQVPKSRSFDEVHMGDKPAFMRAIPPLGPAAKLDIKRHWSCALASLVGVDRSVGRVFRAVRRTGELDKTAFIYISDNGQFYGEHRLQKGKVMPYEEALHEPLVVRMPPRYRSRRVRASGEPAANIDLAPTLLDLAHARPCPPNGSCRTMDGRSLLPLLTRSGNWPKRRALLTEYRDPTPGRYATCEFAGIRTKRSIYVEHYSVVTGATRSCEPTLQVERYNLADDPHELRNICHGGLPTSCPSGTHQVKVERRLHKLRRCAGIRGRDERVDGRPYCG